MGQENKAISDGKQVSIEYSIFLQDDTQVDSNIGKDPLTYRCGKQQILPGLEEALYGLSVGEKTQVILEPDEAYGAQNPEAFKEISEELIPEKMRYEGAVLVVPDKENGDVLVRIDAIRDSKITLDFNHPLAGKTLKFNVKILSVD